MTLSIKAIFLSCTGTCAVCTAAVEKAQPGVRRHYSRIYYQAVTPAPSGLTVHSPEEVQGGMGGG